MKKKFLVWSIILLFVGGMFAYDKYIKPATNIDVFNVNYSNDRQVIEYTDNEIVNRIVNELGNQNNAVVTQVKKLPYAIEFRVNSTPYRVTYITEHNKELETEIDKPLIRIERLEGNSNWYEKSEMDDDAIKLVNILAPSLTKHQINQLINKKVDLTTQSVEFDNLSELDFSRQPKKIITLTKEYGGFIDDSENPLSETKQPNRLFSLNYKQGEYTKYIPNVWINQLVSEMNDVFGWGISVDEVYKSKYSYLDELYLLPNRLNDGYTEYIEIKTSGFYDRLENEVSVPSIAINVERVWQSEDEKYEILSNIVKILEPSLTTDQLEKVNANLNLMEKNEEIKIGQLEIYQEENSLQFRKLFTEEMSSGSLYNLAGKDLWGTQEELIYEDLVKIDEASYPHKYFEEESHVTSNYIPSKKTSSSSSTSPSSSGVNDTIKAGIVTVVQSTVAQREGLSGIDWPWSFNNYNIKEIAPEMYTTQGQFNHGGYIYNFELIIMMRPDTSGRIEFYNVY